MMILVILLAYLSVVTKGSILTSDCSSENEGKTECCKKCPPGFGFVVPCTQDSKGCVQCKEGETFSSDDNSTCKPCSSCSPHSHVVKECNTTSDTTCECNRGFYWDFLQERCKLCDLCPHGYGAFRPCSSHSNAECHSCPFGTYSGILSGHLGCSPCTVCKENQVMLQECTPIQDTVCVSRDLPRFVNRKSAPPPTSVAEETVGTNDYHSEKSIIPMYCAVLGLIVVGLLGYVIVKQWKMRVAGKLPQDAAEDEECLHRKVNVVDNVNHDHEPVRISSIPSSKRREIETLLNVQRTDKCDWRGLATELGYSSSKVSHMESKGNIKHGPMRYLFSELGKRENFTVVELIKALQAIGRFDVIRILNPHIEKKSTTYYTLGEMV